MQSHPNDMQDLALARKRKEDLEAAQASQIREDLRRKLHLRCVELALQSHAQNKDETLSTEELVKRSEALLRFVTSKTPDEADERATTTNVLLS